jgi:hydroxyacylglutathione hydrolase
MKLTRDIALVGGGDTGFNLSAPLDCHIYLIDGGDGQLALVDAGLGSRHGDTAGILGNVEGDGYDPGNIRNLYLTHYHGDHAGACKEMKDRLGCEIHGSPLTADCISRGDEEVISLPFARQAGFYPADYRLEACPVIPSLIDGESFTVGRLKVTPFDTPGHCRGHVSLLVEGGDRTYLIAGDLVFWGGTIIAQNIHDCSIQEYGASVLRMAQVEFDALLPGHFTISLRDGKRHMDRAAKQFGQLMIPRNAV